MFNCELKVGGLVVDREQLVLGKVGQQRAKGGIRGGTNQSY